MDAIGIGLGVVAGACVAALGAAAAHRRLWRDYHAHCARIFQERPLFIIPRGQPVPGAEDVTLPSADGLTLRGCYLKTPAARKGVILFGLEYGSNRWAAASYVDDLVAAGYDVFAYEPRNQGDSDRQPDYEPLQWVTDRDLADCRAALAYLKSRPDAAPGGAVGLFGISKGGSVGLLAAADDPAVRCCVTDGVYGTRTTMVPYMHKWLALYTKRDKLRRLVPDWYLWIFAGQMLEKIGRDRGVRFLDLEPALGRLRRPVLMIHGGGDTYIKPEMARKLFERLPGRGNEFWLIDKAKHNQSLHVAGAEYRGRVTAFFDAHLAGTGRESRAADAEPQPARPSASRAARA